MRIFLRTTVFLAAGVLYALQGAAAPCPPFALAHAEPGLAVDGEAVTLEGTGFCGSDKSYVAWVSDGVSGAPMDLTAISTTELQGVLHSVGRDVTGPVTLLSGSLEAVPPTPIDVDGALFEFSGSILHVEHAAEGGWMTALPAMPPEGVVSSVFEHGIVRLSLPLASSPLMGTAQPSRLKLGFRPEAMTSLLEWISRRGRPLPRGAPGIGSMSCSKTNRSAEIPCSGP